MGNGFSIAYDPAFDYKQLLDRAKINFNKRIIPFFENLGSDFEAVLRFYDVCLTAFPAYTNTSKLLTEVAEDHKIVQTGLIEAITNTHLPSSTKMNDVAKNTCKRFLNHFQNVFTTNYDLLLYWVDRHKSDQKKHEQDKQDDSLCDGFLSDQDVLNAKSVVFRHFLPDRRYMYHLHGALHIYTAEEGSLEKGIRKRRAVEGDNLISQITEGIVNKQLPLIVSEGDHGKKLHKIRNNIYLNTCFTRFREQTTDLVSFGFSFKENDGHICDANHHETSEQVLVVLPNSSRSSKSLTSIRPVDVRLLDFLVTPRLH